MMLLIAYDIKFDETGQERLRKISKICEKYGQRVQNSLFECFITPSQAITIKKDISKIMNKKTDTIRYYNLGKNWENRVEHVGVKEAYNPETLLII